MRFLGLTILVLTLFCRGTDATTIVVVRTRNEIVIGADSKVTDTYGNELKKHACKILQAGNLFIAFEGMEKDRETGFSVAEIASRALQFKPEALAAEKVSILTGLLTSRLFRELVYLNSMTQRLTAKKSKGRPSSESSLPALKETER